MTPLESRLRQIASALDISALEVLASKGLLRRAQKDLERGAEVRILGEEGNALRLGIGGYEVKLPEAGPAAARCSCPSTGVCQHILAATLFLKQGITPESVSPAPPSSTDTGEAEFLSCTREELERWAGKAAFRAGLKISAQSPADISHERGLCIRFPAINAECHVVPGGGLNGLIVSGAGDRRQLAVAAVIAFQRSRGVPWETAVDRGALKAAEGAPRSRGEVLYSCQLLLAETLANGLSRLSHSNQQRWATLAVSSLGVHLPRLALAVRGLSDEVSLALTRDARSDLSRLLARMAQAHALCAALQKGADNPRPDLVGQHRSRYDEIGHLDLVGVSAWPWRTASGYEGLTVLFWDSAARKWNSWSEARPRHQLGVFRAVARYTQPGPWEGAESPRQLSKSLFRLMNARRNAAYRLSTSSKTRALVTGSADMLASNVPIFSQWNVLGNHLSVNAPIGLKDGDPLGAIAVIKPAVWGDRAFDAVGQAFRWLLIDVENNPLLLELPFDDLTEPAIKFLETVPAESLKAAVLVGRLTSRDRGLVLQPFSLYRAGTDVVHLALDTLKPASTVASPNGTEGEQEAYDDLEEDIASAEMTTPFTRLLDELDDAVLALAESGTAGANAVRGERFLQLATNAKRLSLEVLSRLLAAVAAEPQNPALLLRCSYAGMLHRRAMASAPGPSPN